MEGMSWDVGILRFFRTGLGSYLTGKVLFKTREEGPEGHSEINQGFLLKSGVIAQVSDDLCSLEP